MIRLRASSDHTEQPRANMLQVQVVQYVVLQLGTVYNYQLLAFFSNIPWQKLPVLVSDGLRTGVPLECCLFIFFTIYNSF